MYAQVKRSSPTKLIGLDVSNFNDFCLLHIILIMKKGKKNELSLTTNTKLKGRGPHYKPFALLQQRCAQAKSK